MAPSKKLRVADAPDWGHHRGGWKYALDAILARLHSPFGIPFYSWADRLMRDGVFLHHPWVGFLHNVVSHPKTEQPHKYGVGKTMPLDRLAAMPAWRHNEKLCRGIFTLSEHTAAYVRTITAAPVSPLLHPVESGPERFSVPKFLASGDRKVCFIGQWMRRHESFVALRTGLRKVMLVTGDAWKADYAGIGPGVELVSYLPAPEYDALLAENVVFLDLYDAAACNTVLECIVRNTPIVVRDLPAIREYLGPDYPLLYRTVEEAGSMLDDHDLLARASAHLSTLPIKSRLTSDSFITTLSSTDIYKNIRCGEMIM